jgi:hypothetical protein
MKAEQALYLNVITKKPFELNIYATKIPERYMSTFKFLQFDISAEYKLTAICTMGECRADRI